LSGEFKGTVAKNIARSMKNAAQLQDEKVKVYNWKEMKEI
jgi:hypothetical protein